MAVTLNGNGPMVKTQQTPDDTKHHENFLSEEKIHRVGYYVNFVNAKRNVFVKK